MKMSLKLFALLVGSALSVLSHGFIPPVNSMLASAFEGRKPGKPVEVLLRSRVTRGSELVEIEEQLLVSAGKVFAVWRSGGQSVSVIWDGRAYQVTGGRSFPSRTAAVLKYLLGNSADEYREVLLREEFVRRDQLLVYRPGFDPKGDPRSWDLKTNYLKHPDVFLSRRAGRTLISVRGKDEAGLVRTIGFEQALRGISELEWKEAARSAKWTFGLFLDSGKEGTYPRSLAFESESGQANGEVIYRRTPSAKQVADFQNSFRNASKDGSLKETTEQALAVLLSYR